MDAASLLCKSRIGIPTNESPAPLLPPPIGSRRRVGLGFISPQPLALVVIAAAALQGGGCGEAAAEGSSLRHVRPGQIRRQGPRQGQVALLAGRAAVPGGARAPPAAEGQLRGAGGRRGPRLPGGRAGVPLGRDPGAGRQRGPGQQEDPHHPAAPPARHPQRRGAQQAAGRRHHRPGRRPAQHPGRAPAQEDPELQEVRPPAMTGKAGAPQKPTEPGHWALFFIRGGGSFAASSWPPPPPRLLFSLVLCPPPLPSQPWSLQHSWAKMLHSAL